jgi:hypothetical protein
LNLQLGLSCDIGFNWYSLCEPIVVDLAEAGFLSPELLFRLNAIHVLLPEPGAGSTSVASLRPAGHNGSDRPRVMALSLRYSHV